jgi:hypothetical protein
MQTNHIELLTNRWLGNKLKRSSITVLAIILALTFVVTSCSSDKGDEKVTPKSLEEASTLEGAAGLSAAAKLIANGIIAGDGDMVFNQLSSTCQAGLSRTEITKQLRTARAYLTSFLGAKLEEFSVKSVETRRVKQGDAGQARYTIEIEGKSKEVIEKFLSERNSSTTLPSSSQTPSAETTTSSNAPVSFNEPTQWFDFVYEQSSWRLQSCDEFVDATGLLSSSNL